MVNIWIGMYYEPSCTRAVEGMEWVYYDISSLWLENNIFKACMLGGQPTPYHAVMGLC